MNQDDPIVIISALRTPIGNFQGSLKTLTATELGAAIIKAVVEEIQIASPEIQSVIMGCVLSAGLGQAPARQAALKSGLPTSVDCSTINKVCGSGMKSIMLAYDLLSLQKCGVFIAGGMESMSNAPYLLPKARAGYRLGHQEAVDHLYFDGLEDAYDHGKLMGFFAEQCASHYQFTRQQQDNFTLYSLEKAIKATTRKIFAQEIASITVRKSENVETIQLDDGPLTAKPEKIPLLRPVFSKDGTVTAANASSISDGAAALAIMRLSQAEALGLQPIAKIVAHSTFSQEPRLFTTAPIFAIQQLLQKINWSVRDVDLWEINEAFAVVVMAAMKELKLSDDKVNIHGGACVLGHPIGASGARIVVTLLNALQQYELKKGIASLCIGGGEATAIAVERL